MNAPMYSDAERKDRDKRTHIQAVRFSAATVALAIVTFVTTVVWMGQCSVSVEVDKTLCGRHGTPAMAMAAPGVLMIGGVIAFVQTYRVWRRRGRWWVWQGAGWFLLLLMVVTLMVSGRMMT
ncbi:hypothetical protein [Mycobacteroides abscessus]|uniref:Transmembrane protein n=2 Tax=Mycobacteroides abscessus TaxID=36809 RepID=A0A0U0ZHD2_9MYCO|nr:hypothetical protein [Mycobacteroides abscessus]MBL3735664.1 hypothetical protein [Mycobacteroides abscessus subsp. massiliense]MBL3742998.1 hypothetical protein [Mycobacteroides abscessus subsp. massiliense]MBL3762209.1 hypothetical protein [Mycobacteroides abscessus subsp. massiliense]MBN7483219.1 hypothetical protein [Mycobacteroides abscessus subsp. massiliense]MDB2214264.1 hypothetical protein [Mycobacteroides abscessus subsp. massiliense]